MIITNANYVTKKQVEVMGSELRLAREHLKMAVAVLRMVNLFGTSLGDVIVAKPYFSSSRRSHRLHDSVNTSRRERTTTKQTKEDQQKLPKVDLQSFLEPKCNFQKL